MKPIYDFEQYTPPVLHEAMLQEKLEERRRQREVVWVAAGGILLLCCMLFLTVLLYHIWPILSVIYLLYVDAAVTGAAVIALVYLWKRRLYTCQELL